MNHLTLRGTHREMGFQWGARLAERGLRLLDHVPFPLEAERRAFAAACRPGVRTTLPRRPGGAGGAGGGAELPAGDLETVLFTTYALPPAAAVPAWRCPTGTGCSSDGTATF